MNLINNKIVNLFRIAFRTLKIFNNYFYDFNRYLKFSNTFKKDSSKDKLRSTIIKTYHVIEKGLTMPGMRLGFGSEKISKLINDVMDYNSKYGLDSHTEHSIGVIFEYAKIHDEMDYVINSKLKENIRELKNTYPDLLETKQTSIFNNYVKTNFTSFEKMILHRKSIRNYSKKNVPIEDILKSVEIAKNSPSACNRQPTRVHVYSSQNDILKILELQNGNRGFGHLANKLLIITSDLSGYNSHNERNLVWIDGGLFLMNIIYGLQSFGIGSCILNWGVDKNIDKQIRVVAKIPESENIISLVTCGYPKNNSLAPISLKNKTLEITKVHD